MQAVRLHPPSRDIRVEEVEIPKIVDPDDVIVKVKLAGLCGTDLHSYRGHYKAFDKPFIMGHEFVGEIVSLGSVYTDKQEPVHPYYETLAVGDVVVSPFTTSCGLCHYCRIGFSSRCIHNLLFGSAVLPGGQAQFVRVPKAGGTLFIISGSAHNLPDESYLLLADILPTGYFAAIQALNHPNLQRILSGKLAESYNARVEGELTEEDKVITIAVVGLGPVGICALISLLKLLSQTGYKHRVIAVDPNASRRETVASILNNLTSRGLVASDVVKIVDTKDAVTTVEDAGEKIGCHAVLEVVGAPDALKLAYTLIRPFGVISSVGIHTAPTFALIGSQLYDKNVSLNFGRCPARSLFNPAIEVLQWAGDPFTSVGKEYSLVDRVVGFDEATKSYEIFDKGECGKVIFDPWI